MWKATICNFFFRLNNFIDCLEVEVMHSRMLLSVLLAHSNNKKFTLSRGFFVIFWWCTCRYYRCNRYKSNWNVSKRFYVGIIFLVGIPDLINRNPNAYVPVRRYYFRNDIWVFPSTVSLQSDMQLLTVASHRRTKYI